jgi:hypothetical protein
MWMSDILALGVGGRHSTVPVKAIPPERRFATPPFYLRRRKLQ